MPENISDLSRAVSDVLTGEYAKKRLTQDELATRTEMSVWTLQKKLRGRSPVSATDLVVIAQAIGVDPAGVLTEAMADAGLTPNAEVSEVRDLLDIADCVNVPELIRALEAYRDDPPLPNEPVD